MSQCSSDDPYYGYSKDPYSEHQKLIKRIKKPKFKKPQLCPSVRGESKWLLGQCVEGPESSSKIAKIRSAEDQQNQKDPVSFSNVKKQK